MESVLFRTVSGPINSSLLPVSLPLRHGSFSSYEKLDFSPLLHLEVSTNRRIISRALSEPQPINRLRSISSGSQTFPEMLPEVDEESLPDEDIGSLEFAAKCFDRMSLFSASGVASANGPDRDRFGPGGSNSNSKSNEQNKIGAHYKKMLKLDPNDPLLLRNYSKFLHEVERDTVKAEEYYGRAILANPGDGELLSLYGKLIWDTQRDGERAKSYFDQAAIASPDDCMVMGSYAKFMWEAEDDEEEETGSKVLVSGSQPLVAAF
ncbi:putative tetratricopeptide-like helical domain superfamily [Helianthus annuus]|nr:putative tetratricopeptide-like helical domain superfamily [Helianthus annuus]